MLHIRVVTTPGRTGRLLDRLADLPGIRNLIVLEGAARPSGDAIFFDVDHSAANPVFSSPRRGEAARARRGEHAVMTMRRRSLRILQRMERDLASSDPGLDALFQSFARRTRGWDMSWVEEVGRKRFLLFGRRRRERPLTERMRDWTAENWKDP